jgi:hypothetical protein
MLTNIYICVCVCLSLCLLLLCVVTCCCTLLCVVYVHRPVASQLSQLARRVVTARCVTTKHSTVTAAATTRTPLNAMTQRHASTASRMAAFRRIPMVQAGQLVIRGGGGNRSGTHYLKKTPVFDRPVCCI